MTYTDKHLIETYSRLFEGLSTINKIELIECLTKSLKNEVKSNDDSFFASFGSFEDQKSSEEIIKEIKESRSFINKDIKI